VTGLAALAPSAGKDDRPAVPERLLTLQTVTKEQVARDKKLAEEMTLVAQNRRQVEAKLFADGGATGKPADGRPRAATRLDLPRKVDSEDPPATSHPSAKAPPVPALPKHVERDVPAAKDPPQVIRPPSAGKKDVSPGKRKDIDPPPPAKQVDRLPPKKGPPDKNDDPPAVKKAEPLAPSKANPPVMDPPDKKADRPAKKDPPKLDAPPPKKGTDKKDKDGG
jgi:hypothetical protein